MVENSSPAEKKKEKKEEDSMSWKEKSQEKEGQPNTHTLETVTFCALISGSCANKIAPPNLP